MILITGALNKNESFGEYALYVEMKKSVGVFTNACNVGVKDSRIITTPYDSAFLAIPTHTFKLQERGRGSRRHGSQSRFILYIELTWYGNIICQILGSHKEDATVAMEQHKLEVLGLNSAVSPSSYLHAFERSWTRAGSDNFNHTCPSLTKYKSLYSWMANDRRHSQGRDFETI